MIAPRWPLLFVAVLSVAIARQRPALSPVAIALSSLAAIDFARLYTYAHHAEWYWGRAHTALAIVWPGIQAAFAVLAWRRVVKEASTTGIAFALYAACIALAPWSWAAHPVAYEVALRLPFWAGAVAMVVAWACRKDEGPGSGEASEPSSGATAVADRLTPVRLDRLWGRAWPLARLHADSGFAAGDRGSGRECNRYTRSSQAIAYILTLSAVLDVTIGALAPGASWARALPLAWATWIAVGGVVAWEWLKMGCRR